MTSEQIADLTKAYVAKNGAVKTAPIGEFADYLGFNNRPKNKVIKELPLPGETETVLNFVSTHDVQCPQAIAEATGISVHYVRYVLDSRVNSLIG